MRTVTLSHIHDNYDPTKDIGTTYRLVIWNPPSPSNTEPSVTFADKSGNTVQGCSSSYRGDVAATVATVPIVLAPGGLVVKLSSGGAVSGLVNGVANGLGH